MVVLIDNYDSFTYNLYQLVGQLNPSIQIIRNDQATAQQVVQMHPTHIIISPGPGRPSQAGISSQVIQECAGKASILGICLGHQALCEAYGATVDYAKTLVHGKKSPIHIANGSPIFHGLPPVLQAGRYHSLAVRRSTLPDSLLVIAESDDGEVMGVKHKDYSLYGLQFHPESILTPQGAHIIQNFIKLGGPAS